MSLRDFIILSVCFPFFFLSYWFCLGFFFHSLYIFNRLRTNNTQGQVLERTAECLIRKNPKIMRHTISLFICQTENHCWRFLCISLWCQYAYNMWWCQSAWLMWSESFFVFFVYTSYTKIGRCVIIHYMTAFWVFYWNWRSTELLFFYLIRAKWVQLQIK